MRAVILTHVGGPDALSLAEVPDPRPATGHVVIDVHATALNFADLLQRRGTYGTPAELPSILGIECSGTILEIGPDVEGWAVGDEVCALTSGGAYAERVAVPATQLLRRPRGIDLMTAAALPEAACTVWSNLIDISGLAAGDVLLVHGGAGGIGTFATQTGRTMGARVFATAGSADKLERCLELGAERAISYRTEDFVAVMHEETAGRGADVILDNMGASYLARNIDALAPDGRIAMIGLQSGREGQIPLGRMMGKRGSLFTTSLRDRPAAAKARIVAGVNRDLWPHLEAGRILPAVDKTFGLSQMANAHRYMEDGRHIGKILISVKR
ncbi:NAD(P)H-quinone oxidoreductase [Microvirga brassicacearum]|uniref:NAD(P)H-quinone oxidoreductase n=1 Tax=Microvirga brassicacearum TaxID=2580413 RepID=A0A5N3PCH0_9HYPH|nr:NAD(P)H-quinone oxidoreductase [Microvirga brassicacearum]KAB0267400.1 NAD(P)H-quinone oxidoreductase [Microvirga brassicacearum]